MLNVEYRWVSQRLLAGCKMLVYSWREDLLGWGKALLQSVAIVVRFQLIVKDRAKILLGVEFFLLNHMSLDICMCKKFGCL